MSDDTTEYTLAPLVLSPALIPADTIARTAHEAYEALVDGFTTPLSAARAIAPYYRAIEAEKAALEERLELIRGWLTSAYQQSGQEKVVIPDAGMAISYRQPYTKVTPDAKVVQSVIEELTEAQHPLAITLADSLKVTRVSGGVVIGRPR
jgi:hypothetical protein